ncbi:CYTH domain-containing protein [Truepera radiovictrix]|uniref:Adenylate cyclase n=1 Tax=Truepera radiovictrix (strain DSM 17093 / CIP 108686 / LMG 22925 / RQ-24) TaxID=649638 RepID=D7CRH9_TRURR|nr:CYTH domain-containing protein [Truepera radiovictrix]ADI13469.1 adenylate cyclase [Truepera radiovictrix DSM 17093]WMT57970.1 CYTH domain-containing protein [Truepera radiovictrix]
MVEREYKWLVEPAFPPLEALQGALRSCGLVPEPLGERHQEDLYYDLPGEVLRRRGVALRVRRFAGQQLVTLKAPGRVRGGFHEREELELPLATAAEDAVAWPAAIRTRLAALGGLAAEDDLAALTPLLRIATHRRRVGLHPPQPGARGLAELSFDTVRARRPHASAPAQTVQFLELELEAAPDAPAGALEAVAAALAAHAALTPHRHDKVTHALMLLGA